jgi:hypothetical protein
VSAEPELTDVFDGAVAAEVVVPSLATEGLELPPQPAAATASVAINA